MGVCQFHLGCHFKPVPFLPSVAGQRIFNLGAVVW